LDIQVIASPDELLQFFMIHSESPQRGVERGKRRAQRVVPMAGGSLNTTPAHSIESWDNIAPTWCWRPPGSRGNDIPIHGLLGGIVITSHADSIWRSRMQNSSIERHTAAPHRMCTPVGIKRVPSPNNQGSYGGECCTVPANQTVITATKAEQNRTDWVFWSPGSSE